MLFNLNSKPSCQTLSHALEMSKKDSFHIDTWIFIKADCISCIMDSSWQCMSLLEENLIG